MKIIILLLAGSLFAFPSIAQVEYSLGLGGTITSFRGNGTDQVIYIDASHPIESYSRYNGPGKALGWGIELSAQKIVIKRSGLLLGIAVGYERLNSHTVVVREIPNTATYTANKAVTGISFINTYEYLGKRFKFGNQTIDVDLGTELGLPLSATLKVKDGTNYKISKPDLDLRLRLQLKWQYKNMGAMLGYSLGVWDYQGIFVLGDRKKYSVYSNVGRFGLFYQFSRKQTK